MILGVSTGIVCLFVCLFGVWPHECKVNTRQGASFSPCQIILQVPHRCCYTVVPQQRILRLPWCYELADCFLTQLHEVKLATFCVLGQLNYLGWEVLSLLFIIEHFLGGTLFCFWIKHHTLKLMSLEAFYNFCSCKNSCDLRIRMCILQKVSLRPDSNPGPLG